MFKLELKSNNSYEGPYTQFPKKKNKKNRDMSMFKGPRDKIVFKKDIVTRSERNEF